MFVLWKIGGHAVAENKHKTIWTLFRSNPDFPSVNWERNHVTLFLPSVVSSGIFHGIQVFVVYLYIIFHGNIGKLFGLPISWLWAYLMKVQKCIVHTNLIIYIFIIIKKRCHTPLKPPVNICVYKPQIPLNSL